MSTPISTAFWTNQSTRSPFGIAVAMVSGGCGRGVSHNGTGGFEREGPACLDHRRQPPAASAIADADALARR